MDDPTEIAERLRDQIITVEKLAFTLKLLLPQSEASIQSDTHCVCEWMRDAIRVLSTMSPAHRGGE